jgi:hypothetical protein
LNDGPCKSVSVHNIRATAWTSGEYGLDCQFRDALSPLLFKFAIQYANRTVQVKQDGLKLNGTHQLLICADDVNILGRSAHTLKKSTAALVVASKEIGLGENADKTKYTWSRPEIRMQYEVTIYIYRLKIVPLKGWKISSIWEKTLTYQNSIKEDIKSRQKSGNVCYHSVQNLLPSSLLSKNTKIKINRNIILSVVLHECETWSLTLREERRQRAFENRVLRRIFGPRRQKVTGE